MTTVEVLSSNGNGTRLSDQEAREFAETIWAERNGEIKGAELGRLCGRTERWGSKQAARLRNAARSDAPIPAQPTGMATRSVGTARAGRDRNGSVPHRNGPPSAKRNASSVALQRVTAAAVALVAVVAAAASYSHMHALALEAGEGPMARVLPLSVDGLVVAASMTLLAAKRAGRSTGLLPWLALLLGLGASLAANVAAAQPTLVGRLVAAWPPVALALSFELLLRQTRGDR